MKLIDALINDNFKATEWRYLVKNGEPTLSKKSSFSWLNPFTFFGIHFDKDQSIAVVKAIHATIPAFLETNHSRKTSKTILKNLKGVERVLSHDGKFREVNRIFTKMHRDIGKAQKIKDQEAKIERSKQQLELLNEEFGSSIVREALDGDLSADMIKKPEDIGIFLELRQYANIREGKIFFPFDDLEDIRQKCLEIRDLRARNMKKKAKASPKIARNIPSVIDLPKNPIAQMDVAASQPRSLQDRAFQGFQVIKGFGSSLFSKLKL